MDTPPALLGVDFSSAPSRNKPITVARGSLHGAVLRLETMLALPTMDAFEAFLETPGPWFGGFDFPFGLPRGFVESLQLGTTTAEVSVEVHRRCATRMDFRTLIDTWGNSRPAGQRLLHRATDKAVEGISSTSPLQTRYVPVGFMYFEGLQRLIHAGISLPGLHAGDPQRQAVESYPGWLAHTLIGRRSYKNDSSAERLIARKDLLALLEQGRTPQRLRVKLSPAQHEALVEDSSGDRLDAVLCLVQAAGCLALPRLGVPKALDAVEGFIASGVRGGR